MFPKITIITPSYNQGEYIEQTITSVLDQDYPNLDYIIIDGGSSDQTIDIIRKYERDLAYWISEPDSGQANAINKGMARATGEIVNWLNSDDYLEPGALNAVSNAFRAEDASVVCGYTHCYWEETGRTSHTYRMGLRNNPTRTLLNIRMNQPGSFYRMDVFKALQGVNESLKYVFDNELWMRYLCRYGQKHVKLIPDLLAHFRQHGSSKSFGEGFSGFNEEHNAILSFLAESTGIDPVLLACIKRDMPGDSYVPSDWELDFLDVLRLHGYFSNKYMVSLYNDGRKSEAKACLKKAIRSGEYEINRKNLSLLGRSILSLK